MNFFKAFPNEKRPPGLQRLYGGRWGMTRLRTLDGTEVDGGVLAANGSQFTYEASEAEKAQMVAAGVRPDDFFLIDVETGGDRDEVAVLYKFETLTDVLVDEVAPVIDYEMNGLKRVTHRLIARPGIDLEDYDFDVGASIYAPDTRLMLGQFRDESTDAATKIVAVYLQRGTLSKAEEAGPVPATKSHTWQTWVLDATSASEMGSGNTIPGVVTAKRDENVEGFKVRTWSSVGGTITGVKFTYKDVIEVEVPGTVQLVTQAVTVNDLTGTVAIPKVTPRRSRSIAATVTVEITTSPPNTASVAFDLGDISCSVTAISASYNYRGFDRMSTIDGGVTVTEPRRSADIGANISVFPGHYLLNTEASGSFAYTAGAQLVRSSGGSIVSSLAQTSYEYNTLVGTGATSATGYATTGVIRRRSRPVFTDLNGTTYYEVITWSV